MTKPSDAQAMEDAAKEFVLREICYGGLEFSINGPVAGECQKSFKAGWQAARAKQSVEVEELEAAVYLVTIQNTSSEYQLECGDELDGETAIEAWDSLILDTRQALARYKESGK